VRDVMDQVKAQEKDKGPADSGPKKH